MRLGIQRRCLGAVQSGVLSVRDHLSDFRCGDDFFAALCGRLYSFEHRRICGDDRVLAVTGRGSRLGLAERRADVEVTTKLFLYG